jgi:6-phosphogluconate dehydrogenase
MSDNFINKSKEKADIGLIGLAVMGENLALNMASKGFRVAVFNRTTERTESFLKRLEGQAIEGAFNLSDFVDLLSRPRKVFLMVKAGQPVDDIINALIPLLDRGDIIIDGGNSHYPDTIRRTKQLEAAGLYFIGTGVSGGEEGALKGPSLMPGGSRAAWEQVKPIFTAICAKTEAGEPCWDWVGENGAGHYVKMVHNGIEYGDMQLICEAYYMMKTCLGLSNEEMSEVFKKWNQGRLKSYLIEITGEIRSHKEPDGRYTVDIILDTAGQKGTGKWTAISALDEGVPLTLIGEAVFARCLSAMKTERLEAVRLYGGERRPFSVYREQLLEDIESALYAAKLVSYAQGYMLLRSAAKTYGWNLNYGGIALMWRGGCIIRSAFLGKIKEAFDRNPELENLLLDPYFKEEMSGLIEGWRRLAAICVLNGVPAPAMLSGLSWFDSLRSESLPANLLQAQRDYFGAHGYERVDRPRGEVFHTRWTE